MNAELMMLLGGLTAFGLTVYWVRSRDLREKYAAMWLLVAFLLLLCGLFPGAIMEFANAAHLGYAAAVLSRLAAAVYTVERYPTLADSARRRLADLGYGNVHVLAGDGTLGWPEHAPYDGIVAAAGGPEVPPSLLALLDPADFPGLTTLIAAGEKIGPSTAAFFQAVIAARPHPEQGFRTCLGVLSLTRSYDNARVDAACRRGILIKARSVASIRSILKNGLDRAFLDETTDRQPLHHGNIRGQGYFH